MQPLGSPPFATTCGAWPPASTVRRNPPGSAARDPLVGALRPGGFRDADPSTARRITGTRPAAADVETIFNVTPERFAASTDSICAALRWTGSGDGSIAMTAWL